MVRRILCKPYWAVLVTKSEGTFALLNLPQRDWHINPMSSPGYLNNAISLQELQVKASATGLYPSLPE